MNHEHGKVTSGIFKYAPDYLVTPTATIFNPTDAQYLAEGWKRAHMAEPTTPAQSGYHYETDGLDETATDITQKWKEVVNPVVARKWTRLKLKTAIAQRGWLGQISGILAGIEIATDYSAWEALTDCDYIEEFWPTAERWNAMLDGVAAAIGKSRSEIDAFLNSVPVDETTEVA